MTAKLRVQIKFYPSAAEVEGGSSGPILLCSACRITNFTLRFKLELWFFSEELWEQTGTPLGLSMPRVRFGDFFLLSQRSSLCKTG
jgi:hypothetical protein